MKKEKVIVFTHGIDIDGYGCAVLARMAFEDPKIIYADNFNLDELFLNEVNSGRLAQYDKIYITDHCPSLELCQFIDQDSRIKSKIQVFDHHSSRLGAQSEFEWVNLQVKDENEKPVCGTSLFYDYLAQEKFSKTPALDEFCEHTRQYDTWDWVKNKDYTAERLNTLSMAIGREKYIDNMLKKLQKQPHFFLLSGQEVLEIETYLEEYNRQLYELISKIKIIDFDGKKAGYVEIKDIFKNDIAKKVRDLPLGKEIDFMLMPIRDRSTVSLRNIDPDCDVSEIAKKYDGGGHKAAASFPLKNLKLDSKSLNK